MTLGHGDDMRTVYNEYLCGRLFVYHHETIVMTSYSVSPVKMKCSFCFVSYSYTQWMCSVTSMTNTVLFVCSYRYVLYIYRVPVVYEYKVYVESSMLFDILISFFLLHVLKENMY